MKKTLISILALAMTLCMLLSSCGTAVSEVAGNIADNVQKQNTVLHNDGNRQNLSVNNTNVGSQVLDYSPKGEYNEGVVLVKYDGEFNENVLAQLDFVSADPLYKGSSWYTVTLGESMDTVGAVKYLTELDCFENVDYDYVMKNTDGEVSSVDISGNSYAPSPEYLETLGVKNAWLHSGGNANHAPGGVSDVVIAVIDTGVDYNHLDLRNNIWVNSAEIADNGIDDDGNGYIDDINGWDCVGDDKDPMDDNGHGTHVAGIIAAENNKIGTVGIAYNCKVMVLKAGNSSGYFNNSDIAEAIQYAYMNGASVINMSFGGSNISIAVEEALENAYNTSVLVAAAGNSSLCNNLSCPEHAFSGQVGVSYPAALPYVIGVMSCDQKGNSISGFSNFDHFPGNSVEYEVYAPGETMPSTWPGNKYAKLNGTSMAAPTVSGIAALLRSYYPDREAFSTKFLQSQIVNTGKALWEHNVANAYDALVTLPKPAVSLYDYEIDDSVAISAKNNGNGVIDAGETVRLHISLMNKGGVASDVNVSIDTMRNNNPLLTDPYFTFVNTTVTLSDIGTYSVRESGENKYFEIIVSADCPNDYLVDFNIRYTYTNGMDEDDTTIYNGDSVAQFNVSSGYHMEGVISEDTIFTADRLYIISGDLFIPADVNVTFEEGCRIIVHDDRIVTVYGTLIFNGTAEKMIEIYSSEINTSARVCVIKKGESFVSLNYVISTNLCLVGCDIVSNSFLKLPPTPSIDGISPFLSISKILNSYIDLNKYDPYSTTIESSFIVWDTAYASITGLSEFNNNIIFSRYIDNGGSGSDGGKLKVNNGGTLMNNKFFTIDEDNKSNLCKIFLPSEYVFGGNEFDSTYLKYPMSMISDYFDQSGAPIVDIFTTLNDASKIWPYIVSVEMLDKDGNPITTIGREEIKVRVTFNRPMDKNAGTFLTFGTREPYADYRIDGAYISDTVWEGTYTLKAQIENGQNFLKVNNAWAAEDSTKTVFGEYQLHEFTIDTTEVLSMNLQANPTNIGIEVSWIQDDYDTLLGYNIYRSTEKDGNFVRMNPAIIPAGENTFIDNNTEPGVQYWYTFTVVLTDFTESNPAGKVTCTALDTILPNIYHTPVNQGYLNNNLVISATATDNIGVQTVTLYYRAVGTTEWKNLAMSKQNDKFSATVFGSELTLDGLEYYIVASDGVGSIEKGSATTPYTVVIKDASSISRIGDVDGDGTVTTKDALMLMQAINDDIILSDDEFKRADLDENGTLNSAEALRILQYINGNVTTLEM